MAKKIRVYELARELGVSNKEALDLALTLGIGVKSHSSSIEEAQADRVRRKADSLGVRRPTEEPAPSVAEAQPAARPPAPAPPGVGPASPRPRSDAAAGGRG
ncbi:MAG: translation initiation factor IF-2 N-terminal domain-containing protein, partial [Acidimicrobiales bacterium]